MASLVYATATSIVFLSSNNMFLICILVYYNDMALQFKIPCRRPRRHPSKFQIKVIVQIAIDCRESNEIELIGKYVRKTQLIVSDLCTPWICFSNISNQTTWPWSYLLSTNICLNLFDPFIEFLESKLRFIIKTP